MTSEIVEDTGESSFGEAQRRESVAKAAGRLQKAGLIRYVRGHFTILDRQGLEAASCECYQVVKTEFDRLLG